MRKTHFLLLTLCYRLNGSLPGYEHAHEQVKDKDITRQRIYGYDVAYLEQLRSDYGRYVERQLGFNVELYFINRNERERHTAR